MLPDWPWAWVTEARRREEDKGYFNKVSEKFAELFGHFILNPHRLQLVDPAAFEFLKSEVFAGITFKEAENCPLKSK